MPNEDGGTCSNGVKQFSQSLRERLVPMVPFKHQSASGTSSGRVSWKLDELAFLSFM
jgi:hypothetical protein